MLSLALQCASADASVSSSRNMKELLSRNELNVNISYEAVGYKGDAGPHLGNLDDLEVSGRCSCQWTEWLIRSIPNPETS